MARMVVAGLVVIGLITGIWLLWPEEDGATPQPTAGAAVTTTTALNPTTTTIAVATTQDGHVVTTVEEAEAILRDLWFGWFEGIYDQDEERIREVVATEELVEDARRAFDAPRLGRPTRGAVRLSDIELLRSDRECLAVWATLDVTGFAGPDAVEQSVFVLRMWDGSWRLTTIWIHKKDLWEADCSSSLSPLSS